MSSFKTTMCSELLPSSDRIAWCVAASDDPVGLGTFQRTEGQMYLYVLFCSGEQLTLCLLDGHGDRLR